MTQDEWDEMGKNLSDLGGGVTYYGGAIPDQHIEKVDHPQHYGGKDNPYEAIKVIEAWDLDFCLGNVVKYISRAGKKGEWKYREDLEKAAWYLNRAIENIKQ